MRRIAVLSDFGEPGATMTNGVLADAQGLDGRTPFAVSAPQPNSSGLFEMVPQDDVALTIQVVLPIITPLSV